MQASLRIGVLFCLLLASTPANADGVKSCKFQKKSQDPNYLTCLKTQDPRHAEKGRGYTGLGNRYEFGQGVVKHYHQAALFYELACDNGDGNGCMYLARLYRIGRGVKKNRKKAVRLLHRAFSLQ